MSHCFPINLGVMETNNQDGVKTMISNMADQHQLLNHTVPAALLADISPPKYLQKNALTSGDNPNDFLSNVLTAKQGIFITRQSNVVSQCPVQWVVDFEANRIPGSIFKAVCNTHGTTCLTREGRPSCEEFRVRWLVQKFLGITSNGDQVWQKQYQSFPVACTCPGLS